MTEDDGRNLASLTNAHSLEHGILHAPGADLEAGLAAILSRDCSRNGRNGIASPSPNSIRATRAMPLWRTRCAAPGLLVEYSFSSGTWYEETGGLSFPDYLAARPSELRNTWRRKRRRLERERTV